MKDFENFKSYLSDDVMNEISKASEEKAKTEVEKHYDNSNSLNAAFAFYGYYNTFITLELLEKYHKWCNE